MFRTLGALTSWLTRTLGVLTSLAGFRVLGFQGGFRVAFGLQTLHDKKVIARLARYCDVFFDTLIKLLLEVSTAWQSVLTDFLGMTRNLVVLTSWLRFPNPVSKSIEFQNLRFTKVY